MDPIESLKTFGFTKQEALVYLTLLTHGPQTGYEAAKNAGISRSNAYGALAGLAEKGAAMKAGGETRTYSALPASELIRNLRRQTMRTLAKLEETLPDRLEDEAPYLTVTGKTNVLDKLMNMLDESTMRIYISLHSDLARLLSGHLHSAVERGLKTVIISDEDPQVAGATYHRQIKQPGQFNVIADTAAVLTGSVLPEKSAQCLYSRNANLVHLMREAFVNELEIIRQREENL